MKLATLTPCLLMLCGRTLMPDAACAADAAGTTPAPAPAPAATAASSVIIIQATKRPEDLQQVPMSVTAYTSLDISESTDTQLVDLWQHTANTTQMDDHRNGELSIRGIGYGPSTLFGGEEKPTRGGSPIGFYLDGVSLEAQRGMSDFGDLYDVDTVELLRGPQGTLYGRGTLGGVVNVRTKDPTWNNEIGGSVYGGSYDTYRVEAAGGGPISNTLAFRLAVEKDGSSGYYDNITTGSDKTDASNDFSARGKLLWKPNDELSVKVTVQGSDLVDSTDSWVPLALIDQHQTVPANPGYDHGRGVVNALQIDYQFSKNTTGTIVVGYGIANDAVDYEGSRGPMDLEDTAGYNNISDLSIEARIAHTGPDPLTWIFGIYGEQEKFDYASLSTFSSAPVAALGGLPYYQAAFEEQNFNEDARVRDLNAAIYGEGTLKLGAGWEATAGARLGYEHTSFDWDDQITNQVVGFGGPPAFAPIVVPFQANQFSQTDHAPVFLPKGVLDYHITPDVMAYASVARGYRPGGFNTGANSLVAASSLYAPEYTWNYEIGLKTELDRTTTLNIDAFYTDWRNMQVPVTLGTPTFDEITVNAQRSRVYGAELEAETRPLTGLRLWLSVGLLKAYYQNYVYSGFDPNNGAAGTVPVNESGLQFPNIPKWTAAIGEFYQHSSGVFVGATLGGQGATSYYVPNANTTTPTTEDFSDYLLLDAKIGYRASHWSVAVLGRNLTNKVYVLNASAVPPDGVYTTTAQTFVREGPPRTIGMEVTANW